MYGPRLRVVWHAFRLKTGADCHTRIVERERQGREPLASRVRRQGRNRSKGTQRARRDSMLPNWKFSQPEWTARSLSDVTMFLTDTFHEEVDDELTRLRDLAARILQHHGDDAYHNMVAPLLRTLDSFDHDMAHHLAADQHEFFPLIESLQSGSMFIDARHRLELKRSHLDAEHLIARQTLTVLRWLTDGYCVPSGACCNMHQLYRGLEQLERLIEAQLALENLLLPAEAGASRAAER
jgi:iron-sulfur cluster repair protein YtfE (RIC family)